MAEKRDKLTKEDKERINEKDENLSNINEEYLILKTEIANSEKEYDNLKKILDVSDKKLKLLQLDLAAAEINNDENKIKNIKEKIGNVKSGIAKIQLKAKVKKAQLDSLQKILDGKIQELMNDPEIKQQVQFIMVNNNKNVVKKLSPELQKINARMKKIDNLKKLIENDKSVGNSLRGMISAREQLEVLNEGMNNPLLKSDEKNQIENEILKMEEKFNSNKNRLFAHTNKKNMGIELDDLEGLFKQEIKRNKEGRINLKHIFAQESIELRKKSKELTNRITNSEKYVTRYGFVAQKETPAKEVSIRESSTKEDFESVDLDSVHTDPERSAKIREQLFNPTNPETRYGFVAQKEAPAKEVSIKESSTKEDFESVDLDSVHTDPERSAQISEKLLNPTNSETPKKEGFFSKFVNFFKNYFGIQKQLPSPELVKQEPVKQEPVKQEPVKQEPVKQEPVKQETIKSEPQKISPHKDYVNSLRYDIMKDLAERYQRELGKEMKREKVQNKPKENEDVDIDTLQ